MDARLLFWTGAWLNMLVIAAVAVAGVRRAHAGDFAAHRLRMLIASWLVLLFLVAYLFKAFWIGREDLSAWHPGFVVVLRVHEVLVSIMTIGGAYALVLARRLRFRQAFDGSSAPYPAERVEVLRTRHRWAGRSSVSAALGGLLTAAIVLYGMYARHSF